MINPNRPFRVALAGNPNCGKTTIFNALTGTRQHVGNYPGVTVDRKSGTFFVQDLEIELIDLPGVYSLSNSSPEEVVAFNTLVKEQTDLILNVIDSGNAQRNLYLTTQLAELEHPMMLAFNMIDDAKARGIEFDFDKLESLLGVTIVPTIGARGVGLDDLKKELYRRAHEEIPQLPVKPKFGHKTDDAIRDLTVLVEKNKPDELAGMPNRYVAIKLLESDPELAKYPTLAPLFSTASDYLDEIVGHNGMNRDTLMADYRYGVVSGACREAINVTFEQRRQISDRIDAIATNRFLGLPIFLLLMYVMFFLTFSLSEYPMKGLDFLFERLAAAINSLWPADTFELGRKLIVDGIIAGVGGVLTFLPNILFLFLGIAFLEGTGYMARAAFVMDGFMHRFGLHGKSFIPMLLGFGCTVPAIMATRTIESRRDRLTTILILPLMSCGARLTIYSLFIPAFFPEEFRGLVMWCVYIIGIALALGCALALKSTFFKGEGELFVMELPPYRIPTVQTLCIHMWEHTVMYLKKAGTVILGASIILFLLNTFPEKKVFSPKLEQEIVLADQLPQGAEKEAKLTLIDHKKDAERLEYSAAGRLGRFLSIPLSPLGFDWRISSALVGAFAGKELFVAQMGILFAQSEGDTPLQAALRRAYTPLQGLCVILFCLISMPCVATVSVVRKETGSWGLTLIQLAGLTIMAYVITLLVFQIGMFLKIGSSLL